MTDDDKLRAIAALIAEADDASATAAAIIFGPVPAWVPPQVIERAWRTAAGLLADGASPEHLRDTIGRIRSGDALDGPASLPLPFIRAAHEMAGFVYGVSLGERDGLRFLAGDQADLGQRFKRGRKAGTCGPVRALVAKLLAKNPKATTARLWEAVSKRPPRGWQAFDNSQGKYLEGPKGGESMSYRRFANICSEERKKAKGKITG